MAARTSCRSDAAARTRLLAHLLDRPTPALAPNPGITPAVAETWALFQLIGRARRDVRRRAVRPVHHLDGRSAADVLAVLLLARWTGCDRGLHIVPLFETIADLEGARRASWTTCSPCRPTASTWKPAEIGRW